MVTTRSRSLKHPTEVQPSNEVPRHTSEEENVVYSHSGRGSVLWRDLSRRASVTTIETKFLVSPNIAEFWCCVTSPVYAAPALLWLREGEKPFSLHLVLCMCVLTGVFSTLYHASLLKLLSSLDAAQAVITFYTISLLLAGIHDVRWHLITVVCLAGLFLACWRKTAILSLAMVVLVVPHSLYVLGMRGEIMADVCFVCGVACFMLDRFKHLALHSAWHLFVSFTSFRACVTFLEAYQSSCSIEFWTLHACATNGVQ